MVVFCFCWFLILYASTFLLAKNADFFSPLKFISVKYALLNLAFILYVCVYPASFSKHILKVCNVTLEEAFLQYTIVNTVAYISLIAGIYLFSYKQRYDKTVLPKPDYNYNLLRLLALAAFAIGVGVYALFLSRIGGLFYLLSNLDKRVELQGNQYILGLLPLLVVSSLLVMYCIKLRNSVENKVLFGLTICATLFIFSSFGGRLPSLLFIITLIVGWHYLIKPLTINKRAALMFAALSLVLFFYILIVPVLREDNSKRLKNVKRTEVRVVKTFVYNISYTYIDVFAANYFNEHNAWRLKGFFEPVSALFAAKDKSMIPQVDQGVYFNSIVKYKKNFAPPMPRKDVSKISWPTENFGFAYSNFLLPGIIIFFFLQGMVFALTYRALIKGNYHPVLVLLYVEVIFNFNFSSLKLAFFIKIVPLLYLVYVVFNKFVKKQNIISSLKIKL